jgi:hypothetical protein
MGLSSDPTTLLSLNKDEADISLLVGRLLMSAEERPVITKLKGAEAEQFMNLIDYVSCLSLFGDVFNYDRRS